MAGDERVGARRFRSRSPEATRALAQALAGPLEPGAVLALEGDLGAGKTVFVQGLARGLGVEGPVESPTFVLLQEHAGRLPLYHYDAWMEGREVAFLEGGGDEALYGGGVCAIEWAERVAGWLPRPHLRVELRHVDPETREIALSVDAEPAGEASPRSEAARRALEAALAAPRPGPDLEELPGNG